MGQETAYSMVQSNRRMSVFTSGLILNLLLLLMVTAPVDSLAQDLPEYDEIPLFLDVPGVGGGEIMGAIRNNELYLPVIDLFDFLRIRNTPSQGLGSISGFFISPEAKYEINRNTNTITYQETTYNIEPGDIIKTETSLYLKSTYYGKIFGLECIFSFRNLSVSVKSKLELPLIKEMRQEEMRKNLSRIKGEMIADTTIGQTRPGFRFGMADWSAVGTEELDGNSETRLNLNLGAMIAGGEATASLYYNSMDPLSEKQQHYLWRFVNNDFAPLRQISAGKIYTRSTSTIYNPVVGVQFTNTPTTYRRSFGSYTLSDRTEPGWIVELYVNSVLVDYIKADASGFFTFEVPLVYGNTIVTLKYYGPWGEERTREQNISVPFNFLPVKTLEYTASAGIVEDTLHSRFSRVNVNYGLTKSLTIGAGTEYLSSVTATPFMPFVNASLRITNNLLLFGEYAHGVRSKGTLTYRLPSNMQLDLNYIRYKKDQTAINYNYLEERRATLSLPLRIGKLSTYQRFTINQTLFPSASQTTGEWMLSGSLLGVNTNITTYGMYFSRIDPYFYSNLSMSFRLPGGFMAMPQMQYSYNQNKILSAKMRIERQLLDHAFINLSYEQNFNNDLRMAEAGLRYDFSFAQTGLSVRQANRRTTFVEYARGSLINDRKTKYLGADNRTNVGRGGITVIAFIDKNNNGKRDNGEPKASGLNLRANGGRVERSERDTTIRIIGLEPYTTCFIELDQNSFENIAWRLPVKTLSVVVDPNILKHIDIPVTVQGEASGMVSIMKQGGREGVGRIIVNFYTSGNNPAGRTLSGDDGYFSLFSLTPGEYKVMIDTLQLRKLEMTAEPSSRTFTIRPGIDGDYAGDLDFTLSLTKVSPDTLVPVVPVQVTPEIVPPVVRKDTTYMIIHEVTEIVYTIPEDSWAIQIGAFKERAYAEKLRDKLSKSLGKKVEITIAGDYYRVRILDLPTRKEVDEAVVKLNKLGFNELWIVRLLAREQQRIIVTKTDSLARINELIIEEPVKIPAEGLSIQIGAFRDESRAIALRKRISALIGKQVVIIPQDGFFKVRVTGFRNLEEMEKFAPTLGLMGISDIWILPAQEQMQPAPAPRKHVEELPVVVPPAVQPDTVLKKAELMKEEPVVIQEPAPLEPDVALQVAVFHKRAKALRAQKRITSKLDLPVEIIEQWGYYHVIVTGFFTREETYRYYPELAGLGYPGITLIENYRRKGSGDLPEKQ